MHFPDLDMKVFNLYDGNKAVMPHNGEFCNGELQNVVYIMQQLCYTLIF